MTAQHFHDLPVAAVTPWTLLTWPPLLWQAGKSDMLHFQHLGTRVMFVGDSAIGTAGQTLWGISAADGEAGVAWDWVQIARGVVAMADPLSVVTNLQLIGHQGEVLTAMEASLFLNQIVHALPWQHEVARALGAPTQ